MDCSLCLQIRRQGLPSVTCYEYFKMAAEVVLLLDVSAEHVLRAERKSSSRQKNVCQKAKAR